MPAVGSVGVYVPNPATNGTTIVAGVPGVPYPVEVIGVNASVIVTVPEGVPLPAGTVDPTEI
jgi:hypothetical protein